MSLYPKRVARCEHVRVNGTQRGSPALRNQPYCYFHAICHREGKDALKYLEELETAMLPTLEDADSVQLGLAGVIRQLQNREIDHKTAALLLYALQTASANLKRTTLEPDPRLVVIDRECVKQRPIGATVWSAVEGRDYDEVAEKDIAGKDTAEKDAVDDDDVVLAPDSRYVYETRKLRDPGYRDERIERALARQQGTVEN
jgi:hypothetical protein